MGFASPDVPEVKTTRAGSSGPRSAAGAGSAVNRSLVGDDQHRPAEPGGLMVSVSRSSATTTRGPTASMRARRSAGRSCSVHGWATAPMRQAATIAYTHSGRLPTSVITTSPRRTPAAVRLPANRAERSATSPKVDLAPLALAAQGHQGPPPRIGGVHHVEGEVHRRGLTGPAVAPRG